MTVGIVQFHVAALRSPVTSSSTASAGVKRDRDEEAGEDGVSQAKRQRLDEEGEGQLL